MATKYAVQGTALNFGAGAAWEGGVAPASTDVLIWREGVYTYTAGLNQAAVNLAAMKITRGAQVTLGSAGTSLQIDVNNSGDGIIWQGRSGQLYINGAINKIAQESPSAPIYGTGGVWTNIAVPLGYLSLSDQVSIVTLDIEGGDVFVAEHASDIINTLRIGAGRLQTRRSIDDAWIGAAEVILEKAATIADGATTARAILMHPNARLRFRNNAAVTADNVDLWAGQVDAHGAEALVTITNSLATAHGFFDSNYENGPIVFTNATIRYGTPGLLVA